MVCGRLNTALVRMLWSTMPIDRSGQATVYLTPDALHECGTSLLAHKELEYVTLILKGHHYLEEYKHLDPTPMDHIDVVDNVYNRLVIWDGHCPHAASLVFVTIK